MWGAEQEKRDSDQELEDAALERAAQARRLPEAHPGAPGYGAVLLVMRNVKRTPKATLVELASDPRGQVWVSRKHVPHGSVGLRFGTERLVIPVWLYRRSRIDFDQSGAVG